MAQSYPLQTKTKIISGNLLSVLTNFLKDRKQRVVLNGQNSTWKNFGPLLFFVYTSDLSDDLLSNAKFFADDTSRFSVIKNENFVCKKIK